MRTWVRHSLNVGALTAGALLVTGGAAQAGPAMTSTDDTSIGNDTQAVLPLQAPVNLCGNAVAVAGKAIAGCEGGAAAALDPEWTFEHYQAEADSALVSTGDHEVLNGTDVTVPVQAPIGACGNAVAVLGKAAATCDGGADADQGDPGDPDDPVYDQPVSGTAGMPDGGAALLSSGNHELLNETDVLASLQAPIGACGNAIAVLGKAVAECDGGSSAVLAD